ncbi:MAG TPA: hypothetical protein VFM93_05445 [Candidatus Limnocylindria bacterium]|nr:hypothetical protein [Candidatus Limnocylindria bacterium]
MDIHQLRSWIFELFEPLEDDRQYVVFDADAGNVMIDAPAFSQRALRMIRGTGDASLLVLTNRERAADAARFRDALGVQIAAHADDAGAIAGGPDITLGDDQRLRPGIRAIRVKSGAQGATVLLLGKAGGVLVAGDLDLSDPAARPLLGLEFSAILWSSRGPQWSAGKETLGQLQNELPRPKKRFGIFLPAPWDRAYRGRLEDLQTPSPLIPTEETAPVEAAMGPTTLVVSQTTPAKQARAPRPER